MESKLFLNLNRCSKQKYLKEKLERTLGDTNLKKKSTPRLFHPQLFLNETIVKFSLENIKSHLIFLTGSAYFLPVFDDAN
jgi:hypothetical protein